RVRGPSACGCRPRRSPAPWPARSGGPSPGRARTSRARRPRDSRRRSPWPSPVRSPASTCSWMEARPPEGGPRRSSISRAASRGWCARARSPSSPSRPRSGVGYDFRFMTGASMPVISGGAHGLTESPLSFPAGVPGRTRSKRGVASAAVLALIVAVVLVTPAATPRAAVGGGRVVVLGFDGADARLVEKWMGEGKLPNLAKLKADGTFSPLLPTNPAQTPVSWSSFATGNNPGRTQIFDFLKRLPKSYIPTIAMADESKRPFLFGPKNPLAIGLIGGAAIALLVLVLLWLLGTRGLVRVAGTVGAGAAGFAVLFLIAARFLPADRPWAVNNRKGDTFWGLAASNGRACEIFRVPVTFPAEDVGRGRMLSGLGVPDIRGTIGRPTYFTSDPAASLGDNEFSLELARLPARTGVIETRIIGPYNKPFYGYVLERATEGI